MPSYGAYQAAPAVCGAPLVEDGAAHAQILIGGEDLTTTEHAPANVRAIPQRFHGLADCNQRWHQTALLQVDAFDLEVRAAAGTGRVPW